MLTQKKRNFEKLHKKHNPSEETTHDLEQTEKEHQILHEKTMRVVDNLVLKNCCGTCAMTRTLRWQLNDGMTPM